MTQQLILDIQKWGEYIDLSVKIGRKYFRYYSYNSDLINDLCDLNHDHPDHLSALIEAVELVLDIHKLSYEEVRYEVGANDVKLYLETE